MLNGRRSLKPHLEMGIVSFWKVMREKFPHRRDTVVIPKGYWKSRCKNGWLAEVK